MSTSSHLFLPGLIRWYTMLQCVAVLRSSQTGSVSASLDDGCRFPEEWHGRYFQSGLNEIVIRDNTITTKGECIDHDRYYYLFHNRDRNCYHCLLIIRQHRNLLQYKESFCSSRSTLKAVCAQIRVESPLYTLVRDPSKPVRCPLQGAFHFRYNDLLSGFCENEMPSYARPCVGHTRYQLRFQHCVDTATFNRHIVELECLASWKDGSETYFYGRLSGTRQTSKDERYRCFKYHEYGPSVLLAMSADATCRGLRSATDGPFIAEFTRDSIGWPVSTCQYPDWLKGVTWHDLSKKFELIVVNDETLTEYHRKPVDMTSSKRYIDEPVAEYRCIESSTRPRELILISFTQHHCAAKRQCLKVRKLSNNAIQFYRGRWLESAQNCVTESYGVGQLFIAENATSESCPRRGLYHTPAASCLSRLDVGCLHDTSVTVHSNCTQHSFECVTSWSDSDRMFLVLRQHRTLRCFSFRQVDGATVFSEDVTCSENITETTLAPQYSLLRRENCRSPTNELANEIQTHQVPVTSGRARDVTSNYDDDDDDVESSGFRESSLRTVYHRTQHLTDARRHFTVEPVNDVVPSASSQTDRKLSVVAAAAMHTVEPLQRLLCTLILLRVAV